MRYTPYYESPIYGDSNRKEIHTVCLFKYAWYMMEITNFPWDVADVAADVLHESAQPYLDSRIAFYT